MKKIFCVLLITAISMTAKAEVSQTLKMEKPGSNRQSNKMGITTGFGSPFPSLLGWNFNYHVTDFLKATAGYGQIKVTAMDAEASVTTIGGGVDAYVPGWSFSPTLGLHASKVNVTKSEGAEITVQGVEESANIFYAQAGLDWQAQGGFNIGVGQVLGLSGGKASGSYLNIGWYF
jgi:hypothetical protein